MKAEEARFLIVHHTAGSTTHAPEDVPGILRGIRSFHVGSKGWPDIAYNFLIDRHGTVWEGRAGSLEGPVRGDATGGNQGFSQLVCLLGDFTSELPTPVAQDALVATLAWLAGRYGIGTDPQQTITFLSRGSNRWPQGAEVTTPTIVGHRDMSLTSCPGDAFYPEVSASIAPRVHAAATPSPTSTKPSTTSTSSSTTTSSSSTTPPQSSTTTTTTAKPSSTTPPTSRPVAAAGDGDNGVGPGWSVAALLGGALAGLVTWRARRMAQRGS